MPTEPAHRPRPSVLTVRCADQPGIVAAVANLIAEADGNIANADQHTDRASSVFLQRIEIDGPVDWERFAAGLDDASRRLGVAWELHHPGTTPRAPRPPAGSCGRTPSTTSLVNWEIPSDPRKC